LGNIKDIILYDGRLAIYKHSLDLIFYLIANQDENELMINTALSAFSDAVQHAPSEPGREEGGFGEPRPSSFMLRRDDRRRVRYPNSPRPKRHDTNPSLLSELTRVFSRSLYSIIVETDSTTIASRVSRPKADTTEIVINEQSIMNAFQTVRDKVGQRIIAQF